MALFALIRRTKFPCSGLTHSRDNTWVDVMDNLAFDQLFAALATKQLSFDEAAQLRQWLAGIDQGAQCLALIEQAAVGRPCPRCGCGRVHRCGQASGLQRFRCLGCRRSYNALTGTPLARLRKREHWLAYFQCVLDALAVRTAAAKIGVHRTTSFRWRHRFVPAAARQRATVLGGVVEADETYLLESQKGSRSMTRPPRRRGGVARRRGINSEHDCLLVARERTGRTLDFHTGRGPVTAAQLDACLGPVLAPGVTLFSDGARAYRLFASQRGIAHAWINASAGEHARGDIHIQSLNGWHARFKGWLVHFRGVASKYLANYSGWYRVLDEHLLDTPGALLVAAAQRW
jgi:transposase-like protein